ncbi:MAG TPA: shikimate kinase [Chroococcales cyanobacterium]
MPSNVVIIGPPGSGKTSAGTALAKRLGVPFFDTDDLIEKQESMKVHEIFSRDGEAGFRKLERQLLEKLACPETDQGQFVMATGGGIAVAPGNFELLTKIGTVVCLRASAGCLAVRLVGDSSRPLLASESSNLSEKEKKLDELLAARAAVYGRAPYAVHTDNLEPAQVAEAIEAMLAL